MKKYRFKTEKELFEEFGKDWSRLASFNPQGYMDYLLGTSVEIPNSMFDSNGCLIQNEKFSISHKGPSKSAFDKWLIYPRMLILDTPVFKQDQRLLLLL